MKALLLTELKTINDAGSILREVEVDIPAPGEKEVLIRVLACGICHTELDEIEGRTAPPTLPVIPGHQVVGRIAGMGSAVTKWKNGERVGVAWIHSSCGTCESCKAGLQNLCPEFKATGRDCNGGYAEYMTANEDFIFRLPPAFSPEEAAPLLCAGAIGFRSLKLACISDGQNLGLMGFGASGHQVLMMAKFLYPQSRIFVFARKANERAHATELGAWWSGGSYDVPPAKMHAIIDTTPAWKPVLAAMAILESGGRLVINAIRKEDADRAELLNLSYHNHLWMEKEIKSVANITPGDVSTYLEIASAMGLKPDVQVYPMSMAGQAILEMKQGIIRGAKVLSISEDQ